MQNKPLWSPKRSEAYLGVMIDDLITLGTQEPYRMFTSRAEYRLLLREDNADLRLTEIGHQLGLVDNQRWDTFQKKREAIEQEQQRLRHYCLRPMDLDPLEAKKQFGQPLSREYRLDELLRRPEVTYQGLMALPNVGPGVSDKAVAEQVQVQIKYQGYIERQHAEIAKRGRHEKMVLPLDLDYAQVKGLSNEVRQKLTQQRPSSLGQASRIPGMTPAAISILLIHLKKRGQRVV